MSNIALQERIRNLSLYIDRERMRPGCVAGRLSRTGNVVRAETAKSALKEMAANGELKQVGESYYRPMPARVWLVKPWRKRSNAQIGLQA